MIKFTFFLALFFVSWSLKAQDSSFELIGYMPAPGQHINNENTGTPEAAQNMVLNKDKLISLGSFGGYVVLKFKKACANHPQNPYGVDFSVFGNAFNGSSEPGIIYVMQDANQNGNPDDIWYEIAGSSHYHPETINGYQVTYINPHGAYSVPWNDNLGYNGMVIANSYNVHEYYPANQLFTNYPKDSVVFKGTKLRPTYYEGTQEQIRLDPIGFGYADNLPTLNGGDYTIPDNPYTLDTLEGGGGNAIDISWARDSIGNYVQLDSIHFVKIVSANLANAGWLGEVSTDVTFISDVEENGTVSGTESVVVLFHHNPELIVGDSVSISAMHFESGIPSGKEIVYTVISGSATINDKRLLKAIEGGNVTIMAELEDDPSQFDGATINVREPTSIQLQTDLSTLYPGDTIKLEASILDQNNVNIKSLSPSYSVSENNTIKVLDEGGNNSIVALNPGTDTLVISSGFPELQLKVPVTIHSPASLVKVYITVKTTDENILPFQKLEVPVFNLNQFVENQENGYLTYTQPTIAHAMVKALLMAGSEFAFRDDDKSNGKLYLYSVENEGLYYYGWGGETNPSAYAKCWIARKNSNSYLNGFDKAPINEGDTIILYHVSELLSPWKLATLTTSSDSASIGDEIDIVLKETECNLQDGTIKEVGFTAISNKEIKLDRETTTKSEFTNNRGEVTFLINETPPLIISSSADAVLIHNKLTTGLKDFIKSEIKVYQNPVADYIYLKGNTNLVTELQVLSITGQRIIKNVFDENIQKVNVSELKTGFYLLKIVTPEHIQTLKIYKK